MIIGSHDAVVAVTEVAAAAAEDFVFAGIRFPYYWPGINCCDRLVLDAQACL
jgi:hypothetical protein